VAAGLVVLRLLIQMRACWSRGDLRRVWPALRSAVALVWHHPGRWLGAWAWNAALLGVAFAAYLALASQIPAGPALLALVLLQQLFVLVRCGLRVALLGAEIALVPLPPPVEPPSQLPVGPSPEPPVEPSPGFA
jgi:hypothetical protein